ncbi:MAG: hypothetical protein A3J74_05965, partial [Elusimicrobia bacterium RIFCSPHIGHO2_02_FULL_57_9]
MTVLVLLLANLLFPAGVLIVLAQFVFSPRRRILLGVGCELRERLGFLSVQQVQKLAGKPVIWAHAASAGEAAAVSGLLEKILALKPDHAVLMTCSTAAGRQAARQLPFIDVASMAPLDFFPTVNHFLRFFRPAALIIVETELWPHMIEMNARRGAKLCLVNGRLTERSFSRYRPFAPLVKPFLRKMNRVIVQTQRDRERFLALGADPDSLAVCGNMKYDLSKPAPQSPQIQQAIEKLGWDGLPLIVAGSTHPVEEQAVIDAFLEARRACAQVKLVIAPRHVERAAQTAATLQNNSVKFASWSKPLDGEDYAALLIDAMGILPSFYSHAKISFVGGTLVPVGGHNLLEPALAGSPVAFGPYVSHTHETAAALKKSGGGFQVDDKNELARVIKEILADSEK